MALSDKHVKDVCLVHTGQTQCRYLETDYDRKTFTPNHMCKKKTSEKGKIDLAVINGNQWCTGDNCSGYTYLKKAKQGYDVPGSQ